MDDDDDELSPKRPADAGDDHAELVAEESQALLRRGDLGESQGDRDGEGVAEKKEHGAHGMHGPKGARLATMSDGAGNDGRVSDRPPHDLGGRLGYGPVPVDDDAVFHARWEARAFAVTQFAQGLSEFNTDAFRHGIEREDPHNYGTLGYFDRWIRNAERMLVEGGVVATDAVTARMNGTESTGSTQRTTDATAPLGRGAARPTNEPQRFDVGDRVRVAEGAGHPGHTRIPGYVRGQTGTVAIVNDSWVFPDTHAHGQGEQPCWVYAVAFDAAELWPDDGLAPGSQTVVVDLFEPYLQEPSP